MDALVLAVAGLERLGFPAAYSRIPEDMMCPAAGQGAIGVQIRADDERFRALVDCIKDAPTTAEVSAERAFVASLAATCQTPVGAYAKVSRDVIQLTTVLLNLDGTRVKWASREGPTDRPVELGLRLGAEQVEAIEREHGGAAAFFGYGVHDGIATSPGSTG